MLDPAQHDTWRRIRLFSVPTYQFTKQRGHFSSAFKGIDNHGNEGRPIKLPEDVSKIDFQALLKLLYPL